MEVEKLIFNFIESEVIQIYGFNCWLSRKYIIIDLLSELQPDKPEDQTTGFLAYNIPSKDRMKMKTGRFLTRKLKLNSGFLPDKTITNIAEKINIELFSNDIIIELVDGEKITKNYEDEIGSSSCMTGGYAECTRLYEMNPDKIQMLTMYYMNNSARAIVYLLDNGKYYMDRVYSDCNMLSEKMKHHAYKNSWYCYDRFSDLTLEEKRKLVVSDLDWEDGCVPFMDTFGGSLINGKLQLKCLNYDFDLQNTDGYLESTYCCECCESRISEDCVISIDGCSYCEDCVRDNFTYCECCDEYIPNDESVYINDKDEHVCQHCADNHYVCCEDCGEYIAEAYIFIEDYYYCFDCGEKYPICEDCEERFIDEDCIDENGLCEDCRPDESKSTISHRQLHLAENYPGQTIMEFSDENS